MPGPHRRNSFSYKAINPDIKKVLDERSLLDNTVQVGMPFVKVTTTIDLGKIRGYDSTNSGNFGFTLGIHTLEEDIKYQDIYSERGTGEYLIGYTYMEGENGGKGKNKPLYTLDPSSDNKSAIKLLDSSTSLVSDTDASRIPPPGITSATIGRNRNGVIAIAEIKFSVPTLKQLEALYRTFLIPGCGVVVEWGQQFANKQRISYGELGIRDDTIERNMFPWYDRAKLTELLDRIARQQYSLEEILNGYVYPTQGQYQWMFGRISTFSVNSNSDGSYECSMKIVGPSEDSFAYSTRNTVTPPKIKRGLDENPCITASDSVETFFTKTTVGGKNFKTLLEGVRDGPDGIPALSNWQGHVIHFTVQRGWWDRLWRGAAALFSKQKPSEDEFGDTEDAYFITWKFFVNIVLNDEEYGIKSIFKNAAFTQAELDKMSLLRPYISVGNVARDPRVEHRPGPGARGGEVAASIFIDPYENFVGCNENLRSTDPSTLLIVNETAATLSIAELAKSIGAAAAEQLYTSDTDGSAKMLAQGDFYESAGRVFDPPPSNGGQNDRGFLSTGVWINHKAIVQAMASSETILGGISNLLQRMNSATNNFWNLAIDPSEPDPTDPIVPFNYGIVDVNYRESSGYAQAEFFNKVHVFNKFIRDRETDGTRLGSDVIECNIDLSLPKLLFAQIATTGLHQPSDLAIISGSDTTLGDNVDVDHPKFSDANQQLREMFSITSLAPSDEFDKGPDLTQLSKVEREEIINGLVCGSELTQTPAGTGGRGLGVGNSTFDGLPQGSDEDQIKFLNDQIIQLERNIDFCNSECKQDTEFTRRIEELVFGVDPDNPPLPDNRLLSQLTIGEIKQRQEGRRMFAVGKYQLIPDTLKEATRVLNISDSTVFSAQIQEQLGDYLLLTKRSRLGAYLRAENNDIYTAQLELAREFASMPIPVGQNVPTNTGNIPVVFPNDKISYYSGDTAGNTSKISAAEVREVLQRVRGGDLGPLKNLIARFESEGSYDIANVIPNVGDRSRALRVGTNEYRRAINNQPPFIGSGPTPPPPIRYTDRTINRADVPADSWPLDARRRLPDGSIAGIDALIFNCSECSRYITQLENYKTLRGSLQKKQEKTSTIDKIEAQYPELKRVYRYIEMFPDSMVTRITNSGNENFSNVFGSAPGTLSISGDIVIPGINGLRVGELFWVDRIPTFYRTFGAFQIISLEDSIGKDGWTTKIHARFNYLGSAWINATSALLSGQISPEIPLIGSDTNDMRLVD